MERCLWPRFCIQFAAVCGGNVKQKSPLARDNRWSFWIEIDDPYCESTARARLSITEMLSSARSRKMESSSSPSSVAREFRIDKFIDTVMGWNHRASHYDLLCWLQGDIQQVVPHDIALAIWQAHPDAALKFDVISRFPGMRTGRAMQCNLRPFLERIAMAWKAQNGLPLAAIETDGFIVGETRHCPIDAGFQQMRSLVAHGYLDQRDESLSLYAFFSSSEVVNALAIARLRLLVPYIDLAVRKVSPLQMTGINPAPVTVAIRSATADLTAREREILHWVRAGKTNEVIGTILGISQFTVKNHLKRVYQKLNVTNRAHAATKM